MALPLSRLILYVRDVGLLKRFYQAHFDLRVVEEIEHEWVVFDAGGIELALHRVGKLYRGVTLGLGAGKSNAKIVFAVPSGIDERRAALIATGVPMRGLKRFDGFAYTLCDGEDQEGNVFQLSQAD